MTKKLGKMLIPFRPQGNVNENYTEVLSHFSQNSKETNDT